MLNFTANYKDSSEVFYDEKSENYIRIIDSNFINNGFHQVI
jgi:hypothetical protein